MCSVDTGMFCVRHKESEGWQISSLIYIFSKKLRSPEDAAKDDRE